MRTVSQWYTIVTTCDVFRCLSERLLAAKDQRVLLWNLQELKDDEISLHEKALSLRLHLMKKNKVKISQALHNIILPPSTSIHLGCPCHSCYGTHRHRGSQDAHRWTEAGRRGRGTRGARGGAAQATRGSSELQEDRCAHADHGAQRSRGTHPGTWSHADKSVEGTGESWAKKLRPEYDFQYSVQQMFMPNSNSNTLNTKICL